MTKKLTNDSIMYATTTTSVILVVFPLYSCSANLNLFFVKKANIRIPAIVNTTMIAPHPT